DPAERQDIVAGHDAVIVVAGPSATVVEVSIRYAAEMDAAGTPAVVLFPRNYSGTAHYASARATAPVRILPAPELGGGMNAGTPALALLALTAPLTEAERFPDRNRPDQNQPRTLHGPDRTALVAEFHDQGWTDGLPVELPTVTAVERMLSGTSLNADLLVTGTFRPEARPVTVRDVAVNAVMAGALPEHLPAILAGAALMGRQVVDSMTRSVNSFAFAQYIGG
ncbi:hypothetical protein HER39_20205, partial [Arthrobacter deserti]|nr:hypothetical protein [Arthrobacter deserti]